MKRDAYYLFPIAVSLALGGWGETMVARAQIVPDATLPMNSIVTPNGETLTIDGGTQAGGNLFHSFEAFSLPSGEAFFNNGLSVENIITRVTGGSFSEINGLIRANGVANLFLLNPHGIVFGPNARLDIGGSFVGSTADRFLFEDGNFYSATDTAGSSPLLTVNVPIGLQFGPTPGGIEVSGPGHNLDFEDVMLPSGERTKTLVRERPVGLQVQPHRTLALVGGNVTLTGGSLTAAGDSTVSGGRIELGSVAGNNTVALTPIAAGWQLGYEGVSDFQDIQLSEAASVDTSGAGAGAIQISGRSLSFEDGSALLALTLGEESSTEPPSENVTIFTSDSVEAMGTSANGDFQSGLSADVEVGATRKGADVSIETDRLVLTNGAGVFVSTRGEGDTGNLTVNANEEVLLSTSANGERSGLFSQVLPGSTGNGGNVTIDTQRLIVQDQATISAETLGRGNGANLTIRARESVEVINEATEPVAMPPGIRATVADEEATGHGGNLTIETVRLRVIGGPDIATTTLGRGNAGDLTVIANEIELIGEGELTRNRMRPSRLEAQVNRRASGNGGDLRVQADRLLLADGGRISVATNSELGGDAGSLEINATEVELRGTSLQGDPSGLFALVCINRNCGTVTGNAGMVNLDIDRLTVRDGAEVTVSSKGQGNTGNLEVNVNRLFLDGGFLRAIAEELTEDNGGSIVLNTADLRLQNDSEIATRARNNSDGGNITIDTDTLTLLEDSSINANAFGGNGGRIEITTEGLFSDRDPDLQITASSERGIDGVVTINNPENDPSSALLQLPDTPIDVTALINDICKPGLTSEFVVTGRGGLPPTPLESIGNEAAIQVDLVTLSPELASLAPAEEFRSEPVSESPPQRPERLVEAQGWIVGPNGEIILTAHPPQVTPHAVEAGYNACGVSASP